MSRARPGRRMRFLFVYSSSLVVAIYLSGLAQQSILSTTVLFLAAGAVLGPGLVGYLPFHEQSAMVPLLAQLALIAVLFTDGLNLDLATLRSGWRLSFRSLVLGMPLTLGAIAVAAHFILGLTWLEALLIGAVLSPTDPVFAATIVRRTAVPQRVRHLLQVESGLNDGLALPMVLVLLAVNSESSPHLVRIALDVGGGVAIGLVLPWLFVKVGRLLPMSPSERYLPLGAVAVAALLFTVCHMLGANVYLAEFVGGITLASMDRARADRFHRLGEPLAELFKLAAVLVFGTLLTGAMLDAGVGAWLFAALCLLLARPAALGVALAGTRLGWRELGTAAWFGPKGFASVAFALLVLQSGGDRAALLFDRAGLVIALSIVLHSSSDVLVSRLFERADEASRPP